jgi:hypothetical protein
MNGNVNPNKNLAETKLGRYDWVSFLSGSDAMLGPMHPRLSTALKKCESPLSNLSAFYCMNPYQQNVTTDTKFAKLSPKKCGFMDERGFLQINILRLKSSMHVLQHYV